MLLCATATAAPKLSDGQAIAPCAKPVEGMSCIPGGAFIRGSDTGPKNARPQATIELQTFYMDQYEVTVADYAACAKAGKCKAARTMYRDYSRPKQPKVGVSWYHSVAYCKAMGKHLPTEAEWEKAARGTDGRLYPWGKQRATCKRAVIKDHRGRSCGVKKLKGHHPEKGRTLAVGTRAPTQYGLYDMAGNSWEWVYDWYSGSYARCGKACEGVNPQGPCRGGEPCKGYRRKIVRGGSWYWPAEHATTIFRRAHVPSNSP
ncbi:MAG: SUMF1/EgtB/PvdO family nonheme iron enzyme, partial [Deltaproteobacteria bacterium]|nr:SUMF1/EgtB/PvdO family nonheme iron enzyme [Deltaproteobacteria bacterium]